MVVLELETYHEVLTKTQLEDFSGCSSRENQQLYGHMEKHKWKDSTSKENRTMVKEAKETRFKVTIRASLFTKYTRNSVWELVSWGQTHVKGERNNGTWLGFTLRSSRDRKVHGRGKIMHPTDKEESLH